MNEDERFLLWADPASPWTRWVKPVLFAFVGREGRTVERAERAERRYDLRWLPDGGPPVALVVDVPGAEGVALGVELARRGYRPVPLYNAYPFPPDPSTSRTAVDVASIVAELDARSESLGAVALPADAPPAFLLDANRDSLRFPLRADSFDNRSRCLASDFPSAEVLKNEGIGTAIVVERTGEPAADLTNVLESWAAQGIALLRVDLDAASAAAPLRPARRPWLARLWRAILDGPTYRISRYGYDGQAGPMGG